MPPPPAQIPTRRLETVDSTNLAARRLVERGEHTEGPLLLLAETQTAGRGRLGSAWASPRGGLWSTLLWPARLSPKNVLDGLGLRVGFAVARAVERHLARHGHGEPVQLKWPNDVYVEGRKIAGALVEVFRHDGATWILVGAGVNGDFSATELPEPLRERATTIEDLVGREAHVERLTPVLLEELRAALTTEGVPPDVLEGARERLYGRGKRATVRLGDGTERTGVLIGLSDKGVAELRDDRGAYFEAPGGVEFIEG